MTLSKLNLIYLYRKRKRQSPSSIEVYRIFPCLFYFHVPMKTIKVICKCNLRIYLCTTLMVNPTSWLSEWLSFLFFFFVFLFLFCFKNQQILTAVDTSNILNTCSPMFHKMIFIVLFSSMRFTFSYTHNAVRRYFNMQCIVFVLSHEKPFAWNFMNTYRREPWDMHPLLWVWKSQQCKLFG